MEFTETDQFESSFVPRLSALQPAITEDDLLVVEDVSNVPFIVLYVTQLVRLWAHDNENLPDDFEEVFDITGVKRQGVAFVVSDVQILRREIRAVEEPWSGNYDATSELETGDLFELHPFDPTVFPPSPEVIVEDWPIPGQEEKVKCSKCAGKCYVDCEACVADGIIYCDKCGGNGEILCSTCMGGGQVLRGGQTVVNCTACSGTGLFECLACKKVGTITCPTCNGVKTVDCKRCDASGCMKRRQVLHSETSTHSHVQPITTEDWGTNFAGIVAGTDELYSQHTTLIKSHNVKMSISPKIRDNLRRLLEQKSSEALNSHTSEHGFQSDDSERSTGLRVRLHGSFAYHVSFEYRGKPGSLIVVGSDNLILILSGPTKRTTILDTISVKLGNIFTKIGMPLETTGLDHKYARAVRQGTVFLLDTSRVVETAAEALGALLIVTETGYRLIFENGVSISDSKAIVTVDFAIDMYRNIIIRTNGEIGVAHRDRYPQALAYCHQIAVGRLALVPGFAGEDRFVLIDIRSYAMLSSATFEQYLRMFLYKLREIQNAEILQ